MPWLFVQHCPQLSGPHREFPIRSGIEQAIARGIAYAPYADMIWCETAKPDLEEARIFAEGIHSRYPGKMLAFNCSPSFNWKMHLDDDAIAGFQENLAQIWRV